MWTRVNKLYRGKGLNLAFNEQVRIGRTGRRIKNILSKRNSKNKKGVSIRKHRSPGCLGRWVGLKGRGSLRPYTPQRRICMANYRLLKDQEQSRHDECDTLGKWLGNVMKDGLKERVSWPN